VDEGKGSVLASDRDKKSGAGDRPSRYAKQYSQPSVSIYRPKFEVSLAWGTRDAGIGDKSDKSNKRQLPDYGR
jgi:hypothetical protein